MPNLNNFGVSLKLHISVSRLNSQHVFLQHFSALIVLRAFYHFTIYVLTTAVEVAQPVKICKIRVGLWKKWKNRGKITSFKNIGRSGIKESPCTPTIFSKNENAMTMRKKSKLQKIEESYKQEGG